MKKEGREINSVESSSCGVAGVNATTICCDFEFSESLVGRVPCCSTEHSQFAGKVLFKETMLPAMPAQSCFIFSQQSADFTAALKHAQSGAANDVKNNDKPSTTAKQKCPMRCNFIRNDYRIPKSKGKDSKKNGNSIWIKEAMCWRY